MSHRHGLITALGSALLVAICLPLLAQETADICIANGIVARIRDKGPYDTVQDRMAAIDKAIVDIISNQDSEHPQVSLKQKDGIWTVYCWDVPVIRVYKAEAEANNLTEKQLGMLWVKNFRERLPLATPVSKMDDPFGGAKPKPAEKPVEKPAETTPSVSSAPTVSETQPTVTAATGPIPQSAALLLIIDALRISRALTEDEWIDNREQIARNLLDNMSRFLSGKPMQAATQPVKPEPVAPVTPPTTVIGEETKPEPSTGAPTTVVETKPTPETTTVTTTTPSVAEEYTGDPNYARVPQKERIGRKFEAVQEPYQKLRADDLEAAKAVGKLLKASRNSFATGDFDASEQAVDEALTALGIDPSTIK